MRNFANYRDAMRYIKNSGTKSKPYKRTVWLGQFGETVVWTVDLA